MYRKEIQGLNKINEDLRNTRLELEKKKKTATPAKKEKLKEMTQNLWNAEVDMQDAYYIVGWAIDRIKQGKKLLY